MIRELTPVMGWSEPPSTATCRFRRCTASLHSASSRASLPPSCSRWRGRWRSASVGGLKPLPIYRAVLTVLRKQAAGRVKAAVNFLTVKAHNAARLESFRAAGVTRVGIAPERLEPPTVALSQARSSRA